jgi:hypothetical protein
MGGPHVVSFSVPLNKAKYEIRIKQQGKREISIYSEDGCYDDLLFVYYALETLLMLCDGQFYPVTRAFDGTDITSSFVERKLPSHTSADFMVSAAAKLLEFDTVLNESVFLKWVELSEKLDLIHKMVMYCLSAVEMPKDMQCAYKASWMDYGPDGKDTGSFRNDLRLFRKRQLRPERLQRI